VKESLKRLVRVTTFFPGVSHLYRLYYLLAVRLLLLLVRTVPEISAVFVHRSFGAKDWLPGYSDIDLVITLVRLQPSHEITVLPGLWRKISLLRTVFPFIGTVQLITESELTWWLQHGGIRRLEFPSSTRLYARKKGTDGAYDRSP